MIEEQKWQLAFEEAWERVEATRREYPGSHDVVGFSTGGGSTNTDFSRSGTSQQDTSSILPALLTTLLTATSGNSAPSNLEPTRDTALSGLLTQSSANPPGVGTLNSAMAVDPTGFTGNTALSSLINRNPYSSSYETATADAYKQRAGDALAQVQSGHEAVRGGTARPGIAQGVMSDRLAQGRGQEIRSAQVQDANIVNGATGLWNMIETARRGTGLQGQHQLGMQALGREEATLGATAGVDRGRASHNAALGLASQLLGVHRGLTTDALVGKGNQGTSSWGVNLLGGCCFIFLEALNGELPWYVEAARDNFHTPTRRKGYKWMSNWLVPAMQQSRVVRWLVNALMVKPCLLWGAHYFGVGGNKLRALLKPVVYFWFHTWFILGKTAGRRIE